LRFLQAIDCKERGWEKGDKFEHSVCYCNWRIAKFCSLSHWAKTHKKKQKEKGKRKKKLSVSALCMFSGICAIEREKKLNVFWVAIL
jgi:hypothetical protein